VITTVAGDGRAGFSGDGGLAVGAELRHPAGVTVDNRGEILIADTGNNRVRKVSTNGTMTTLAGNGRCGSDQGADSQGEDDNHLPASASPSGDRDTVASLCQPFGVAADTHGNVYITDPGHSEVKVVNAQGDIQIFAGNGMFGYSGDGGPATSARLGLPTGIAVNALGDVFIADSADNVVREVLPSGIIETFAGNGHFGYSGDGGVATKARLATPTGVGTDALGDVFVADTSNNRIREVDPASTIGTVTTVAGTGMGGFSGDGGPATAARLSSPVGSLAVTGRSVYFSDTGNQRVRGLFTGPPPVLPETGFVILLPLVGIAAGAGVLYIRHRRRGAAPIAGT
jgi:hypothetical protein